MPGMSVLQQRASCWNCPTHTLPSSSTRFKTLRIVGSRDQKRKPRTVVRTPERQRSVTAPCQNTTRRRIRQTALLARRLQNSDEKVQCSSQELGQIKKTGLNVRKLLCAWKKTRPQPRRFCGARKTVPTKCLKRVEEKLDQLWHRGCSSRQAVVKEEAVRQEDPKVSETVKEEVVQSAASPDVEAAVRHLQHDHSYCRSVPPKPSALQAEGRQYDHEELRELLDLCMVDMEELPELTQNEMEKIGAVDLECFQKLIRDWDVPADLPAEPEDGRSDDLMDRTLQSLFTSAGSTETRLSASGASQPLGSQRPWAVRPWVPGCAWCITTWSNYPVMSTGFHESTSSARASTSSVNEVIHDGDMLQMAQWFNDAYPDITTEALLKMIEEAPKMGARKRGQRDPADGENAQKYVPLAGDSGITALTEPDHRPTTQDLVLNSSAVTTSTATTVLPDSDRTEVTFHDWLSPENREGVNVTPLSPADQGADSLSALSPSPAHCALTPPWTSEKKTLVSRKRRGAKAGLRERSRAPAKRRLNRTRPVVEEVLVLTPPPSPPSFPSSPCVRASPPPDPDRCWSQASRSRPRGKLPRRLSLESPSRHSSVSSDSALGSDEEEELWSDAGSPEKQGELQVVLFPVAREVKDSEKDSDLGSDEEDAPMDEDHISGSVCPWERVSSFGVAQDTSSLIQTEELLGGGPADTLYLCHKGDQQSAVKDLLHSEPLDIVGQLLLPGEDEFLLESWNKGGKRSHSGLWQSLLLPRVG